MKKLWILPIITLFLGLTVTGCSDDENNPVSVESISLDKTTLSLEVGEKATLKATVLPVDVTNPSVTWSSNDATVATVTEVGEVTAVKGGTTKIIASAGGQTAECALTVTEPEPEFKGKVPSELSSDYLNITFEYDEQYRLIKITKTEMIGEDIYKKVSEFTYDEDNLTGYKQIYGEDVFVESSFTKDGNTITGTGTINGAEDILTIILNDNGLITSLASTFKQSFIPILDFKSVYSYTDGNLTNIGTDPDMGMNTTATYDDKFGLLSDAKVPQWALIMYDDFKFPSIKNNLTQQADSMDEITYTYTYDDHGYPSQYVEIGTEMGTEINRTITITYKNIE